MSALSGNNILQPPEIILRTKMHSPSVTDHLRNQNIKPCSSMLYYLSKLFCLLFKR